MPDRILFRVPSWVEDEPGYRTDALRDPDGVRPSVGSDGQPSALWQPIAGRWLGQPVALTSSAFGWVMDTGTANDVNPQAMGGRGINVTSEGTAAAPWVARLPDVVTAGAGLWLDVYLYEPEEIGVDDRLEIELAGRWRLTLRPGNAKGQPAASVEEFLGGEWVPRGAVDLLGEHLYGEPHALWLQPVGQSSLLIANRTDPQRGGLYGTEANFVWAAGDLILRGVGRAFAVARKLSYPTTWTLESDAPRPLGYVGTQPVEAEVTAWLPDEAAEATVAVFEGALDGDPWGTSEAAETFAWRVTVASPNTSTPALEGLRLQFPETLALDGLEPVDLLTHESIRVLRVQERSGEHDWDRSLILDVTGPKALLDELAQKGERVQWIVDTGPAGGEMLRFDGIIDRQGPGEHWQAVRRESSGNGFAPPEEPVEPEEPEEPLGPPAEVTEYRSDLQIIVESRWALIDRALFRGGLALDGMTRSEAYALLLRMVPLYVDDGEEPDEQREVQIEPLIRDDPLPATPPGRQPAYLPRIGSSVGQCLRDLRQIHGPDDRMRFHDAGARITIPDPTAEDPELAESVETDAYVSRLFVEPRWSGSLATFYHTTAEYDAARAEDPIGVGLIVGPRKGQQQALYDPWELHNHIVVVGQEPAEATEGPWDPEVVGRPIGVVWEAPDSWRRPTLEGGERNPLYVRQRIPLVVVRPDLTSRQAVEDACRALADEYYRVRAGSSIDSYLLPELYPGDLITIMPSAAEAATGAEPAVRRITGMTVTCEHLGLPAERRYPCRYDLEIPSPEGAA